MEGAAARPSLRHFALGLSAAQSWPPRKRRDRKGTEIREFPQEAALAPAPPDNPRGSHLPPSRGQASGEAVRRLKSDPSSGPSSGQESQGSGPHGGLSLQIHRAGPGGEQERVSARHGPGPCGFGEGRSGLQPRGARDKQEADENNSAGSWAVSATWRRKRNRIPNRQLRPAAPVPVLPLAPAGALSSQAPGLQPAPPLL